MFSRSRLDAKQMQEVLDSKHHRIVKRAVDDYLEGFRDRKNDAEDLTVFATRQLVELEKKVQGKIEKDITGTVVFMPDYTGSVGASSFAVQTEEAKGIAKQIGNSGKDFPEVELGGDEDLYHAKNYGLEYNVSIEDIDTAAFSGQDISDKKAKQISRGMDEGINNCLWDGDGRLVGLKTPKVYNQLTKYTGFGGTKLRDTAPDTVLEKLILMKRANNALFAGRYPVDTLDLCDEDYEFLTTARLDDLNKTFLVEMVIKLGLVNIINSPDLKGRFASNKDGLLMLPRDMDIARSKLPGGRKRSLPVTFNGYIFTHKYISRCSGLHSEIPSKISIATY